MNLQIFTGYLGRDPERKGKAVVFSVATTDRWKGSNGEAQERTTWHQCVAFGRLSEVVLEHLSKGSRVLVIGRPQTNEWEDRDGNKRSRQEVVLQQVEFLGTPGERSSRGEGSGRKSRSRSESRPEDEWDHGNPPPISDDDVPF